MAFFQVPQKRPFPDFSERSLLLPTKKQDCDSITLSADIRKKHLRFAALNI